MNDNYSTVIGTFKSNPVLEILEDEKPLGENHFGLKDHFSFGKKKAQMIVMSLDIIKEFVDNHGEQPRVGSRVLFANTQNGLDCIVTHHTSFRNRNGVLVERPYLEIQASDDNQTTIGFGRKRAEGILSTEADIRKFALR